MSQAGVEPPGEIYLERRSTGELVEATLHLDITEDDLKWHDSEWKPFLAKLRAANPKARRESDHWDWRKLVERRRKDISCAFFSIRCEGLTQGLMIVNLCHVARLDEHKGKDLVYIDYVEAAPWNDPKLTKDARFAGVGTAMATAAIERSLEEGFNGRIGLHSLPQAVSWYADKLQMVNLGQDKNKENLPYFEMTAARAAAFLEE